MKTKRKKQNLKEIRANRKKLMNILNYTINISILFWGKDNAPKKELVLRLLLWVIWIKCKLLNQSPPLMINLWAIITIVKIILRKIRKMITLLRWKSKAKRTWVSFIKKLLSFCMKIVIGSNSEGLILENFRSINNAGKLHL